MHGLSKNLFSVFRRLQYRIEHTRKVGLNAAKIALPHFPFLRLTGGKICTSDHFCSDSVNHGKKHFDTKTTQNFISFCLYFLE